MVKIIYMISLIEAVMLCNFNNWQDINGLKASHTGSQQNDYVLKDSLEGTDQATYVCTKEACRHLLDDLSKQKTQYEETIRTLDELKKKYNATENQKEILKTENGTLRACSIALVLLLSLFILVLLFHFRHKKLKLKINKLSETVKHTQWGLLLTKEFITINHISYDELERMLNREKSLNNLNNELYNKLHDALIQQKVNYSAHLLDRLTTLDSSFGKKFQQLFPECSADELLMATMIHHKWKLTDMTTIFHLNLEALRKRKTRLAYKISAKLNKEIDIDYYLTNL